MELWLALASRREVRDYASAPIPPEVERRILDAGRLAGSAQNRQPWRFVLVESAEKREALAGLVFAPGNIRAARLVVGILVAGKGPLSFDAGRCAQNMLLTAWDQGVGGSPNGSPDTAALGELLGAREGEQAVIVLTFGYPARPRDPAGRPAEEWSERANRQPLDELVDRI
jgi:nitroreductase